jgi:hypothetical protein
VRLKHRPYALEIISARLMGRRTPVAARRRHGCWDHLIVAPLWVAYQANLGTLLRTCDAVGACIAVPRTPHYRSALARGNTLPERFVHWVAPSKREWLWEQRHRGSRLVAVETIEGGTSLPWAEASRQRTVLLLGPCYCWGTNTTGFPRRCATLPTRSSRSL